MGAQPGPAPGLERLLLEEIAAHGPIDFARYMELALYHPDHGYFSDQARAGWRGDWLTSSELTPLFGRLWARAVEGWWEQAGRPAEVTIVEIGPGEGTFAQSLDAYLPAELRERASYVLVERAARARARDLGLERSTWLDSTGDLPPVPFGFVFLHEVLDNVPVHIVERTPEGIVEIGIGRDGDHLVEVHLPAGEQIVEELARRGLEVAVGERFEVAPQRGRLLQECAMPLLRGAVVVTDYGHDTPAMLHAGTTLVGYSRGGADTEILRRPGRRDVTSHVDWGAAAWALAQEGLAVLGPDTQRTVLQGLGAADVDDELQAQHLEAVLDGRGSHAVRALSQRQALTALLDPEGLGGHGVLVGLRRLEPLEPVQQ